MKKCKIIHINDGTAKILTDGDRHFSEEYLWAEEVINSYLREGYEVKQMIPEITPNQLEVGKYSFYNSGFTVYLEKESEEQ